MNMSQKGQLLIVEDDAQIARQLKWALANEYDIQVAGDPPSALKVVMAKKPPVVTLDLGLPPMPNQVLAGMKLLGQIIQHEPHTKVIVITGNDDHESALQAISQGAWDYYHKPIDIEQLKVILSRASYVSYLERENLDRQKGWETDGKFEDLIGNSSKIRKVFAKVHKVSRSDVSVMIQGESGTGKELIARAIHNRSDRREKAFVAINCGAIPENLLEAELFGHEKGAYTGAHVQRKGKVEYANGGTLFLDEIGELPAFLQVKLLRFLQERTIERIGGRECIEVDVRIIAATIKNFEEALSSGSFREDLYYRLSVVSIEVPPLRGRDMDIPMLAYYFLRKSCREFKRRVHKFEPQALQAMIEYEWPGNVRELENRIKRAVVMGEGPMIRVEDMDLPRKNQSQLATLREFRDTQERDFVCQALVANNWNIARTAEQIGVSRPSLYDLIKKHDLQKQSFN